VFPRFTLVSMCLVILTVSLHEETHAVNTYNGITCNNFEFKNYIMLKSNS